MFLQHSKHTVPPSFISFIDFFRKYNPKNDAVFGYFISSEIQIQLQICNGLICCLETFVPILSYWSGLKCEVVEICCKNLKLLQENSCLCPFSLHCSSTFQQCSSCNTLLVFLKFFKLCIPLIQLLHIMSWPILD